MFSQPKDPELVLPRAPLGSRKKKRFFGSLSPFEKLVLFVVASVLIASGIILLSRASNAFVEEVPASGGVFTEGVVGSPRFINPVLAISNADRDVSALVYAGLMKATPMGLRPELAERFSISSDGLSYQFFLHKNSTFHDGESVTADDVVFTIEAIQNSNLKSPRFANWEGVTVTKISEHEVVFTLLEPYAPFLENTTIGILPKHIWEFATEEEFPFSDFNTQPIGAGPYQVARIKRSNSGIPEIYEMERFDGYITGRPHITQIDIRFFRSEQDAIDAFIGGDIGALNGVAPERVEELLLSDPLLLNSPLPRIFGVFFNQNRASVFARLEVRQALDALIDKQALVDDVLLGYGSPIESPIPLEVFPESMRGSVSTSTREEQFQNAEELLTAQGWEKSKESGIWTRESKEDVLTLSFSLATANTEELVQAAEHVAGVWREFGAAVEVEVFDPSDLTQNIIRPRRYDALLFGEIIGRELDLFAFWHSSQRNDPGLNIALYTSITADALLEEARATSEPGEQLEAYTAFEEEVQSDAAAIFLYSPDFLYVAPADVQNIDITTAAHPSERFLNVHEWYIKTNKVWNIFD